jgi:hypothetical protein
MSGNVADAIDVLLDRSQPLQDRRAAAVQLGDSDYPDAFDALTKIAADAVEDPVLASEAGVSLARICIRQDFLEKADLAELTSEAYIAFDETVADHQRASGMQ